MRVGFIGLGNMGGAAARNIQRAGFELVVHDIRPDPGQKLLAHGATWADSPAELIDRVDVAVSMVFGPPQIEAAVAGPNGLLQGDCRGKVWIDLTTSSPDLMRRLGRAFREAGGQPVDAPVTGAVDAAIKGEMIMFVGGDGAAVELARPVLEAMGSIRRVGRHGNGYVAKLVNNQLWMIHAAAIGESMVAARKAGLEPEVWWEVMKGGAGDSWVMQHDVPSIFAGHYDPSFRLALCLKDLDLIDQLARQTGTRSEMTRAAHDRFREAAQRYGLEAGELSVCRLIEEDAGVNLRVEGDWPAPWEAKHAED